MIEPTAVVFAESEVAESAYIGHFALVGHPRRIDPRGGAELSGPNGPWEDSAGAVVMERAVVSAYCHIDDGVVIEPEAWLASGCRVGHDTRIRSGAQLLYACQVFDRVNVAEGAVIAGFVCNDVRVGPEAQVFGSLVHRLVDAPRGGADPRPEVSEPAPVIGAGAIVGTGAVVVGGVTVGAGAYIAAGAVLTRDAEPHTLYVGVPARPRGPAPKPFA